MTVLSCVMATVTAHGHQRITGFLFPLRPLFFPLRRLKHSQLSSFCSSLSLVSNSHVLTHTLLNSISLLFHSYLSPHPPWMFLFPTFCFFLYLWTEKLPNSSHGPQPCLTQWNYEPCHVRPPKMDGSWWRVLTKCLPLEEGMANHFWILALRTPWTVWKGKKIQHWKINSPGR